MNALPFSRFQSMPLREIRPAGWLQDFLDRQVNRPDRQRGSLRLSLRLQVLGQPGGRYQRLL